MTSSGAVVALIEPVGSHGGMDYYDSGLCRGLTAAGGRAVWYSCDVSEVRGDQPVELVRSFRGVWGKDPGWKRGIRYLAGFVRSLRDARQRGARLAHFHVFHVGPLEAAGVVLARLSGLRSVITVHDVEAFKPGGTSRLMQTMAYGLSARLIVHNDISRRELIARCAVPSAKVRVVPHGSYLGLVEPPMDRIDARRALGLPESGERLLLFFGQIKDVKGLDLLLEAFGKVRNTIGACRLVIAGKVWKSDFSQYQAIIDRYGMADQVDLRIRYIPDDEVAAYYSAADLIVLPYRKIYQSGVLLMAMSFGTPVLASDLPGMTEIVEQGRNGYLFKAGDASDLADQLLKALADEQQREVVAAQALKDMDTRFSWDAIGRDLKIVYQEALES
jgi:D-inositol-3-phosphate glycosyltransferase